MARVMIADDVKLARHLIRGILAAAGHEIVCEVASGLQAVEGYRQHQPDIVLMDIGMEGMDGVAATRKIISEFPKARIVMVSATSTKETVKKSAKAGAADFILKPIKAESVRKIIDRALAAPPGD